MILQSLHGYYERRMRDPDPLRRLPAPGLEDKEIPFILEITRDGSLVGITDTRRTDGRKRTGTRFLVPQGLKKASGIAANLLWDNPEYVLGFDARRLRLSPADAALLDPQQRLFLDTALRALEDAGRGGTALDGARVGVFVGGAPDGTWSAALARGTRLTAREMRAKRLNDRHADDARDFLSERRGVIDSTQ